MCGIQIIYKKCNDSTKVLVYTMLTSSSATGILTVLLVIITQLKLKKKVKKKEKKRKDTKFTIDRMY